MGQALKLLITVNADGSIQVTGPIDNPVVCYGFLEEAKNIVRKHNDAKSATGIVEVRGANGFPVRG